MKNLKNYFFSVLVFAAMSLNAAPVIASYESEASAGLSELQRPPSEEDAADYVEDRGHEVYYVQPIEGSADFRVYIENGQAVRVYVSNNRIIGNHSDGI